MLLVSAALSVPGKVRSCKPMSKFWALLSLQQGGIFSKSFSVQLPKSFLIDSLQTQGGRQVIPRGSLPQNRACSLAAGAGGHSSEARGMVRMRESFAWLLPEVGVRRMSLKYCRVTLCPFTPSRGFCTGGRKERQTEIL